MNLQGLGPSLWEGGGPQDLRGGLSRTKPHSDSGLSALGVLSHLQRVLPCENCPTDERPDSQDVRQRSARLGDLRICLCRTNRTGERTVREGSGGKDKLT